MVATSNSLKSLLVPFLLPHHFFSYKTIVKKFVSQFFLFKRANALFVDVDGTLWPDLGRGSILKVNSLREEMRHWFLEQNSKFDHIILVTNQTLFAAKGNTSIKTIRLYRKRMKKLLRDSSATLIKVCNHHPDAANPFLRKDCPHRKPNPIAIHFIVKLLRIDVSQSAFIGDRIDDIATGLAANIRSNYLIANPKALVLNKSPHRLIQLSYSFHVLEKIEDFNFWPKCEKWSALILCAGFGRRLFPYTRSTPKPLLALTPEKTILGRLSSQLSSYFPDFEPNINISYLADKFIQSAKDLERFQHMIFHWEPKVVGSEQTVRLLWQRESRDLLVIHGDLVLDDFGMQKLRERVEMYSNVSFMVCHKRNLGQARSIVHTRGNLVVNFQELSESPKKTSKQEVLVNSGIYWFTALDLDKYFSLPNLNNAELTRGILPFLVRLQSLRYYVWESGRISVDSIQSYERAQKYIKSNKFF